MPEAIAPEAVLAVHSGRFVPHSTGKAQPVSEDPPTRPPEKDREDWVTGEEPMTGPPVPVWGRFGPPPKRRVWVAAGPETPYLGTLAQSAGEDFDPNEPLTNAEASRRIDELQRKTGRSRGREQ